jgi:hypothetical protein
MSDAMPMQEPIDDRAMIGTMGSTTPDKLIAEAIPRVGENPAKTSSQQSTFGDVFSEFGYAAYQSGIERPLTSLKQLVGMQVESAKPESELHGAMEVARVVGSATGQIVDFMLLSKFALGALNKVTASAAGAESATLKALAHNEVARATFTSASVGFVNGAVFTPLNDGESSARRLGNGLVDAGSFAMMGGLHAELAAPSQGFARRVVAGAVAGYWGGATEGVLNPLTHGQLPNAESVVTNAAAWAVGNVIAGEALGGVGKGLNAVKNAFHVDTAEFTSPADKAVPPAELTKPPETPEVRTLPPIADVLPEIFKDGSQVARAFEHAPHDAPLLDQVGVAYAEKLSALGLPNTATPLELFDKIAETSRQVSAGSDDLQTHTFYDDGSSISRSFIPHGRGLHEAYSAFKTADGASLNSTTLSFGRPLGNGREIGTDWGFRTPSVTGYVDGNGEIETMKLPPIADVLPEIFRDDSQAAMPFGNSPPDAALIDQLGVSYAEKLSALGVPNTATPSEVFDKIVETWFR